MNADLQTSTQPPESRAGERILALVAPVSISLLARLADTLAAFRPEEDIIIPADPEVPGTIEFRALPRVGETPLSRSGRPC